MPIALLSEREANSLPSGQALNEDGHYPCIYPQSNHPVFFNSKNPSSYGGVVKRVGGIGLW